MKKKILVLSSSYPKFFRDANGGFVYELSKRLSNNYDVIVLAPWEKGLKKYEVTDGIKIYRHKQFFWNVDFAYGIGLVEKLKKNPFKIIYFPFFLIFQIISIVKILKREQIDLIHAHWIFPQGIVLAIISSYFRQKKCRNFLTIHGSDLNKFDNKIGWFFIRFVVKKFDFVTAVSNEIKYKILKNTNCTNIQTLPMGVDTSLFIPEQNKHLYQSIFKNNNINLLFVGICVESKGVSYLIEAIKLLKNQGIWVNLLLIGDDTKTIEYKRFVKKNELEDLIIFLGPVKRDDIPVYFNNADIFILPSLSEGWPLSIMEAMSSGLEVIVSELPVFKNNVEYHNYMNLVKLKDSNDIFLKLLKIIHNFNGKRLDSRNFAINNFDWTVIAEKYSKIFDSLIN